MDYKISFQEMAKLGQELLAKQESITLSWARGQVLWLKYHSSSNSKKEEDISHHLKMYHPEWTKEQIDAEYIRLLEIRNMGVEEAVGFINQRTENCP